MKENMTGLYVHLCRLSFIQQVNSTFYYDLQIAINEKELDDRDINKLELGPDEARGLMSYFIVVSISNTLRVERVITNSKDNTLCCCL
jgi:hypothetical protein